MVAQATGFLPPTGGGVLDCCSSSWLQPYLRTNHYGHLRSALNDGTPDTSHKQNKKEEMDGRHKQTFLKGKHTNCQQLHEKKKE